VSVEAALDCARSLQLGPLRPLRLRVGHPSRRGGHERGPGGRLGRGQPRYTAADADAGLSSAADAAEAAASKAAKAKGDVAALVKWADSLMSKARKLAATVASC